MRPLKLKRRLTISQEINLNSFLELAKAKCAGVCKHFKVATAPSGLSLFPQGSVVVNWADVQTFFMPVVFCPTACLPSSSLLLQLIVNRHERGISQILRFSCC